MGLGLAFASRARERWGIRAALAGDARRALALYGDVCMPAAWETAKPARSNCRNQGAPLIGDDAAGIGPPVAELGSARIATRLPAAIVWCGYG